MGLYESDHLSKEKKVKMGGYYKNKRLVDRVYEYIRPYLEYKKKLDYL